MRITEVVRERGKSQSFRGRGRGGRGRGRGGRKGTISIPTGQRRGGARKSGGHE